MMKKYITPEMEISKFAMEDVITTSAETPAIKYDELDPSYQFAADADYGTFNQ